MLAGLVRLAVRRYGIVSALALVLLVYGTYRILNASLDIFPEFAAKRVVVQTEVPGYSPEQVETLVTLQVEKSLAGLLGLASIRSESLQGLSVVTAVFGEDTDLYRDRQLVGERLATLQGQLPTGIGLPQAVPLSSSSATVLTVGVSSAKLNLMELRSLVDWTIVPRLMAVPGVADVNVFGGDIKQLQIQVEPDRLRRYALSLDDVLRAAEKATGLRGAGFVENENQRISLQLSGLPADPQSVAGVVVARKDGVNVTLGEIARVSHGSRPPIGAASIDGKAAIVMMVIGQYGANTLSVSRAAEKELEELSELLARQEINLNPHLFRPSDYIERSVGNLSGHLLIGAALVIVVLYTFLFHLRAALIPALAIPLSLLGAALILLAQGVNLNIMVLGGLALALGEVVDDAVIDTENIFRRIRENQHRERPRPLANVVLSASLEVRGSVVYASAIVVLGFVPLLTLGGVGGRLFAPLGHAYILAILVSLLTALTLTPALCFLLLTRNPVIHPQPPLVRRLLPGYAALLRRFANSPTKTVATALCGCAAGLVFAPPLGGDFLPELREGHYIVHTSALPGTSLQESLRMGGELARQFLEIQGVVSVSQWAGRAERGADTYGSHYSEYEVHLRPLSGKEQQAVLDRLRGILGSFPGLQYEANTFLTERIEETISGFTSPIVINLFGADLNELDAKAADLAQLVSRVEGATDVQVRSPSGSPLLQIKLDPQRLASFGIRPLEAAQAVEVAYGGLVVGRYYENHRGYDVTVILDSTTRQGVELVGKLPLRGSDGVLLTLEEVADMAEVGGRYNILHQSGQRVQTVTSQVAGRDLDSFLREIRRRVLSDIRFPSDMYPVFTGAAVEQAEARSQLVTNAALAGSGILLLIYVAIGSIRNTMLTLANLPFSLVGGVAGAILAHTTLSVGVMLGFVTLFGITVRNSIMLISHYRHLVDREKLYWNVDTVILGAQQRLPSILMTAVITALAMLPIAIDSDNPGREIMGPMAAIIVGGLMTSTTLNLLILPTILWRFGKF
jgi:CzcA family heavy metal efflux pump